jgi:hypothetical protein
LLAVAMIMYAGVGTGELGLGNEDIQENVFFHLSGPILGPLAFLVSLAVLTSSASSLQSTFVGPARTLLSMGHYGALPPAFARVSPRFFTPGYATIVSAIVASAFYAVMRVVSENTLWDTILTLGMMICFYYGSRRSRASGTSAPVVRLGAQRLLHVPVPARGRRHPRGPVLHDAHRLDGPRLRLGRGVGGVGIVFILGMLIIVVGIAIMIWQSVKRPAFFRGETLGRTPLPAPVA